eukprot:7384617-Prymnesium_polylepis.1
MACGRSVDVCLTSSSTSYPTPRPPTASTHSPAESSSRWPRLTPSPFKKPTNTIRCTELIASATARAMPAADRRKQQ